MSVSHPESPSYGQHLSPAEVVETFAPSDETVRSVVDWLIGSGFARDRLRLTASRGWIEVNATTAEVEDLLNTEYHIYRHPSGVEQFGLYISKIMYHKADQRYHPMHRLSLIFSSSSYPTTR